MTRPAKALQIRSAVAQLAPVQVVDFELLRRELKTAATARERGAPDCSRTDSTPPASAARAANGASHWSPASRRASSFSMPPATSEPNARALLTTSAGVLARVAETVRFSSRTR